MGLGDDLLQMTWDGGENHFEGEATFSHGDTRTGSGGLILSR